MYTTYAVHHPSGACNSRRNCSSSSGPPYHTPTPSPLHLAILCLIAALTHLTSCTLSISLILVELSTREHPARAFLAHQQHLHMPTTPRAHASGQAATASSSRHHAQYSINCLLGAISYTYPGRWHQAAQSSCDLHGKCAAPCNLSNKLSQNTWPPRLGCRTNGAWTCTLAMQPSCEHILKRLYLLHGSIQQDGTQHWNLPLEIPILCQPLRQVALQAGSSRQCAMQSVGLRLL